ncbi:transposable element Tcb2 transposase [Trichonephila clavipes]|nr:transposable element Tcb2 transposase [Trichonephila clavipes]
MSPIKHEWDIVGRRITRDLHPVASTDELWLRIQTIWNTLPQADIQNVFNSMPRRVAALIAARGCTTTGGQNYEQRSSGRPDNGSAWNSLRSRIFLTSCILSSATDILVLKSSTKGTVVLYTKLFMCLRKRSPCMTDRMIWQANEPSHHELSNAVQRWR